MSTNTFFMFKRYVISHLQKNRLAFLAGHTSRPAKENFSFSSVISVLHPTLVTVLTSVSLFYVQLLNDFLLFHLNTGWKPYGWYSQSFPTKVLQHNSFSLIFPVNRFANIVEQLNIYKRNVLFSRVLRFTKWILVFGINVFV